MNRSPVLSHTRTDIDTHTLAHSHSHTSAKCSLHPADLLEGEDGFALSQGSMH